MKIIRVVVEMSRIKFAHYCECPRSTYCSLNIVVHGSMTLKEYRCDVAATVERSVWNIR